MKPIMRRDGQARVTLRVEHHYTLDEVTEAVAMSIDPDASISDVRRLSKRQVEEHVRATALNYGSPGSGFVASGLLDAFFDWPDAEERYAAIKDRIAVLYDWPLPKEERT